jgi:hypothetical protein
MAYTCPVCGYPDLRRNPRSDVNGGSYEICASCGFQFGVSDDDRGFSYDDWRSQWVRLGMPWDSAGFEEPPKGWDPVAQLSSVTQVPPADARTG